jgi:hypothetical protein
MDTLSFSRAHLRYTGEVRAETHGICHSRICIGHSSHPDSAQSSVTSAYQVNAGTVRSSVLMLFRSKANIGWELTVLIAALEKSQNRDSGMIVSL